MVLLAKSEPYDKKKGKFICTRAEYNQDYINSMHRYVFGDNACHIRSLIYRPKYRIGESRFCGAEKGRGNRNLKPHPTTYPL